MRRRAARGENRRGHRRRHLKARRRHAVPAHLCAGSRLRAPVDARDRCLAISLAPGRGDADRDCPRLLQRVRMNGYELISRAQEVEHCFVRDLGLTICIAMSLLHRRRLSTGRREGTWNRSRVPTHNADVANASVTREHAEGMPQSHFVNTLRRCQSQLPMVTVHGLLIHSARLACDLQDGLSESRGRETCAPIGVNARYAATSSSTIQFRPDS